MTEPKEPHVWLLELLPPESINLTKDLLRVLWVPPDMVFLWAAVSRLHHFLCHHDDLFEPDIKLLFPLNGISDWLKTVARLAKHPVHAAKLKPIVESPAAAQNRLRQKSRHFLFGYLSIFPAYVAILTARRRTDPLRQGHDRLSALFMAHAMAHQEMVTWGEYVDYLQQRPSSRTPVGSGNGKTASHPLRHASSLTNASIVVRTLVEESPYDFMLALAKLKNASEIDELRAGLISHGDVSQQLRTHLRYLASFLMERHHDHSPKTETNGRARKTPPTAPPPTKKPLNGTFLETDFAQEDAAGSDANLVVIPIFTAHDALLAAALDMPIEELVPPPSLTTSEIGSEDQVPDNTAIRIWTRNEVQWRRRMNQFHRWQPDYVNVDNRRGIILWLQKAVVRAITQAGDSPKLESVVGPLLVLASIGIGRPARNLSQELMPLPSWDGMTAVAANVVYDLEKSGFWVRVARPDTDAKPVFGARPISDYVLLPDYLACTVGMKYWYSDLPSFNQAAIDQSIDEIHRHLQTAFGVSPTALWTQVPRGLLETSGHFSAGALLTAWRPVNAAVDLHYLTPRASTMVRRYRVAMRTLLGQSHDPNIELPTVNTPEPDGWIGMPNTPTWEHVEAILADFHQCARQPALLTSAQRHNLMTLYTIMMLTFALGVRHTIEIDPKCREMETFDIAYFKEKGASRFLVVPCELGAQLRAYDRHRASVANWAQLQGKLDSLGNPLFFLLDTAENPELFHPTQFGSYLNSFNILFELPLNSLRRLVFTQLVELGLTGITLDYYIGHYADGREPFVIGSGVDISELAVLAEEIDILLRRHGFLEMAGFGNG